MANLFGWMFGNKAGRKDNDQPPQKHRRDVAPGTEITFDSALIPHFVSHHRELVNLVVKLRTIAIEQRYADIEQALLSFKRLLQQHLLEENVRLYTYLSHCLVADREGSELMTDMRQEMGDIGRKVTRFLKHHLEFKVDATNASKFVEELDGITAALADRIKREETSLYTLYQPPGNFAAG